MAETHQNKVYQFLIFFLGIPFDPPLRDKLLQKLMDQLGENSCLIQIQPERIFFI